MRIFWWQNIFAGPSRSRCYSAYPGSIGCCGAGSVGSTGIAIAFRGFARCQRELDGGEGKILVWRLLRIGSEMAHSAQAEGSETRGCPYCGKQIRAHVERCPFCREAVATSRTVVRPFAAKGRAMIRQGLLYILLAGVIHYFAAGYSGVALPVAVPSMVTQNLTPILFLCGVSLGLYGVYLRARS
jgi:hypothetical protein